MKNTKLLQLLNHIDTLRIDKKVWEEELIRTENYWMNLSAKTRSKKQKDLIQTLLNQQSIRINKKIFEIEDEIEETKEKINYKDTIL